MQDTAIFTLPDSNIQVLAAATRDLNYFDTQSICLPSDMTALQAWAQVMSRPMPIMKPAFAIRDGISSLFGVKKIGGFSREIPETVQVGDMLDFFLVEYISDDVLTLTARDKHLEVMTCVSVNDRVLAITSSVKTHNFFGRAYMVPVGVAHKIIVQNMLKRLKKTAE